MSVLQGKHFLYRLRALRFHLAQLLLLSLVIATVALQRVMTEGLAPGPLRRSLSDIQTHNAGR